LHSTPSRSVKPGVRPNRGGRGTFTPRAAILGDVTDLIAIPLGDGTQILATVKTNAQGVHTIGLECDGSKPGLVLHWGVIRPSTGEEWQLLPPELNPPGTTVYKEKALQSPFPAFGALQLVLDPGVSAVEFCLTTSSTGEWFNDNGRNFRVALGVGGGSTPASGSSPTSSYTAPMYDLSNSPPPPPPSSAPPVGANSQGIDLSAGMDILYGVAAYLRWEQLGKPAVNERERSDIYAGAVNHITTRMRDGESLDSLEREFGLPPGMVKKTSMEQGGHAAPPPTPVAPSQRAHSATNTIVPTQNFSVSPSEIAALCDRRAGGSRVLWRKELNLGEGVVNLLVIEARKTSSGDLQLIAFAKAQHNMVLHWATISEPAGEWTQPPHGWTSNPSNSWGTGGASWETEMEPVPSAPGWCAATIEAPTNDSGLVFVLRTEDNKHWIKDDGQDFMVFEDERRSNADMRALVKQRKEEARRARKRQEEEQKKSRKHDSKRSSGGSSSGKTATVTPVKMPAKPVIVTRKEWTDDDIRLHEGAMGAAGASHGVAGGSVNSICGAEEGATRSLMHRYNAGSDLLPGCRADGEGKFVLSFLSPDCLPTVQTTVLYKSPIQKIDFYFQKLSRDGRHGGVVPVHGLKAAAVEQRLQHQAA
tara:strand:- start:30274 stop:32208 length:1935 start_codon:yes stop_codon:yes gene_type:complete